MGTTIFPLVSTQDEPQGWVKYDSSKRVSTNFPYHAQSTFNINVVERVGWERMMVADAELRNEKRNERVQRALVSSSNISHAMAGYDLYC